MATLRNLLLCAAIWAATSWIVRGRVDDGLEYLALFMVGVVIVASCILGRITGRAAKES